MIKFFNLKQVNLNYQKKLENSIKKTLKSGMLIYGNECKKFEEEFNNYCGTKYCIGVGNGLDALSITLRAWKELGKIKTGDEVIVPANTYIASILPIIQNDLKPVLVEPNNENFNLHTAHLENFVSSKTKVLLVVHLYGLLAPMKELLSFAKKHHLLVLEDSAQAHGSLREKKRAGNWGNASAFSFYPTKNLGALGDGGAVTTNNRELADVIRTIANYGSKKKYENIFLGMNSRLDEIQAAVLRIKLKRLDVDNHLRRNIANSYLNGINNPKIQLPKINTNNVLSELSHVWHLFVVRTKNRNKLKAFLKKNGIETIIHYPIPPHKQKALSEFKNMDLPITESIHNQVLSLPIHPFLTKLETMKVISVINKF